MFGVYFIKGTVPGQHEKGGGGYRGQLELANIKGFVYNEEMTKKTFKAHLWLFLGCSKDKSANWWIAYAGI